MTAIAHAFWDHMRFSVDAANRLSDEEGSEAIADQMFLRLELLDAWMEMEVAREQLWSSCSKSPHPKQLNEVPRSQ